MTAEVALLNRHAVALAADSAVTLGSAGYPMKIYNTANKLHMLAEDQPVGIMIYNNAELVGVGWETLVKLFRAELGPHAFPRIEGYADAFVRYLCSKALLFVPEQARQQHLLDSLQAVFKAIRDTVHDELKDSPELSEIGRMRTAGRVINQYLQWFLGFPELVGLIPAEISDAKSQLSESVEQIASSTFQGLRVSDTAREKLDQIAEAVLVREVPTPDYSGIVIAGFGEDQIFPQLHSFRVFGYLGDTLRRSQSQVVDISHENNAYVGSFAQSDMVGTFMEGLDPGYLQFLDYFMNESLSGLADVVLARVSALNDDDDVAREELVKVFGELEEKLSRESTAYRHENHVNPVIASVALMPKEELTRMAESLVSLTSLKRRATMDHETVGGPVDVAVITKGDGFVWLERKHYFEADLNPRFLARYSRANVEGARRETEDRGRPQD